MDVDRRRSGLNDRVHPSYPRLEFLLSGGRFWVYSALLELPLAVVMVYGTERLARTGTGAWGRSQTKEFANQRGIQPPLILR